MMPRGCFLSLPSKTKREVMENSSILFNAEAASTVLFYPLRIARHHVFRLP